MLEKSYGLRFFLKSPKRKGDILRYVHVRITVDELGIELNIKGYDETGKMQNAIYILLDGLLGEYDVTMTVDWIDWKKLDENEKENLQKLIKLRDLVDAWKR